MSWNLSNKVLDEKIFTTEVSNLTSISTIELHPEEQEKLAKSREETKHLNNTRKLQLSNRSSMSAKRVERKSASTSAQSYDVMDTNHQETDGVTEEINTNTHQEEEDEFEGEYNFDSDDDDLDYKTPEIHRKPSADDITANIYNKACRKLGVVPNGSIQRGLANNDIKIKYSSLGPEGAKACAIALVYNHTVQELDLTGNNIGDLGAIYLAEMLSVNNFITTMNLSENTIGSKGIESLCEELAPHRFITSLNLSANSFGDEDVRHIADMLTENNVITQINLSNNCIWEKGGKLLGDALEFNDTLEVLDLSWNHLRCKGVTGLCKGLRENKALKELLVGWNGFHLHGCIALSYALENNTSIESLDLTNNRINTECLTQLLKGIQCNRTLFTLKLSLNPINTEGASLLLRTIQEHPDCGLKDIDLQSLTVCTGFIEILDKIQETRELKVTYGIVLEQSKMVEEVEDYINDDPLIVLMEYMRQRNMRLLDLFNSLDADGSKSLSREEFRQGLMDVNLPLSPQSLDKLLDELDIDGDGEVDFSELMEGQKEFRRRVNRLQSKKTNNSEDNKFIRIQKKVATLLQAREAIQMMKKLANASKKNGEEVQTPFIPVESVSVMMAQQSLAPKKPGDTSPPRRNSIFLSREALTKLAENTLSSRMSLSVGRSSRGNSIVEDTQKVDNAGPSDKFRVRAMTTL